MIYENSFEMIVNQWWEWFDLRKLLDVGSNLFLFFLKDG